MPDWSTRLIHLPKPDMTAFAAQPMPVIRGSTTFFDSVADLRARNWRDDDQYPYGLGGTPTTRQLERQMAQLEGGEYALLAPSGLAAIALITLALLKQGDEILIPANVYGPTWELAENLLAGYGIHSRLYDPMQPDTLIFQPNTRLLWLEAAGSVTLEFPDLAALVRRARKQQVLTVLDNTWGAGLAFAPFALPDGQAVDVSMHALTKYPSGGADILLGSVVTRDHQLHLQLKRAHQLLGFGVSPADADLVLRSLPSMPLRYQAQDQTTRQLASWLQQQPQVAQVLHPVLSGHPGHDHWLQHTAGQGAASLLSLVFRQPQAQIDHFCEALRYFRIGFSWGGPMSLVVPYDLQRMRQPMPDYLQGQRLVRLVIGLEAADDLQGDLQQALQQAFGG